MKSRYLIFFLLFFIVTLLLNYKFQQQKALSRPEQTEETLNPKNINHIKFFSRELFNVGVSSADKNFHPVNYKISGAIVSHFDLVSNLIAQNIKEIGIANPKTLILIGPNHYEKGDFKVATSKSIWDTPLGYVYPETKLIDGLVNNNLAKVEEEVVANDHATTVLLPYIKYYSPEVHVVQLLIKKSFTMEDAKKLSDYLVENFNDDTVLIASIDFSHYLTASEASEKDKETITAINNFDMSKLLSFNSDHLDSPGSLVTLLMTMQKLGKTQKEILFHGNSSNLKPEFNSYVTSYYSMLFH